MQKRSFLKKAAEATRKAGPRWRAVEWPNSIPQLQLASKQLKELYRRNMVRRRPPPQREPVYDSS